MAAPGARGSIVGRSSRPLLTRSQGSQHTTSDELSFRSTREPGSRLLLGAEDHLPDLGLLAIGLVHPGESVGQVRRGDDGHFRSPRQLGLPVLSQLLKLGRGQISIHSS